MLRHRYENGVGFAVRNKGDFIGWQGLAVQDYFYRAMADMVGVFDCDIIHGSFMLVVYLEAVPMGRNSRIQGQSLSA